MPLTEHEREELAKKIDQQRKAMWKGQTTGDRQTKNKRSPEKDDGTLKRQQKPQEVEQASELYYHVAEDEVIDEPDEVEPPSKEQRQDEREELAKKIKQQRRAIWKGEPATRSKEPKSARSISKALHRQEESESAEQQATSHSNQQETEEKNREYRSKAPHLKLALIVIISLIGAIALGVAIGYFVAARGLINV